MAGERDTAAEVAAALQWWTAKRRDLAVLLAHDDGAPLTEQFLKVHAVVTALETVAAKPAPALATPAAAPSDVSAAPKPPTLAPPIAGTAPARATPTPGPRGPATPTRY